MSVNTAQSPPVADSPSTGPSTGSGQRIASVSARLGSDQGGYHVLMIAPTSFFADYGCHVRILEEARVLRKLGHNVTVVTYHSGNDVAGLDIERTTPIPWWRDAVVGSSPHKIAYDILLSFKVLRVAWRRRPDVIHGHLHEGALIGWPLSLLGRVPLVFDFQGSLTSEMVDHRFLRQDGPFFGPMRRLEEFINRLPATIITSSEHAARLCVDEYGCRPECVEPIPDAVNPDVFRPGLLSEAERRARKEALGIPPDRHVVVYLGLLAEYQGTDLLVRAAARLLADHPSTALPFDGAQDKRRGSGPHPDVHFLVMGYPGRHRYQHLAVQLGIADHITLTGRIPYEQAPEMLALGDVAVAPKLSATEGSGKLLNYMAMALPTAAFDTPVSREYLGVDGVYAPRADVDGLALAMRRLLDDPEQAATRGRRLRERAIAKYSWDDSGRRLVEIYERVMAVGTRKNVVGRTCR
ncbi:MAG: glycosyltransferase family 4 protein [Anaerolineae bacterium]